MNYDPIKAARELLMSDPNVLESFKRAFVAAEPCSPSTVLSPRNTQGLSEERRQEIRDEERQAQIDEERYAFNHPGEEE